MSEYECERACQYAMDVGLPEYSGLTNGTCGNCDHYAPVERECAICYPLGVECEGECEGRREAMHEVVVGHVVGQLSVNGMTDLFGGVPATINRTKPMCHSCAVAEKTEHDWGHADV